MIAKRLPLIILLIGLALALTFNRAEGSRPVAAPGESEAPGHPG
jgi:hypothetical protein